MSQESLITFLTGPCTVRDDVNPDQCDSNGYYKPRYCWRISSRPREVLCACFHPMNGSMVPRSGVIAPADDRDEDSPPLPDDASIDSVPESDEKPFCIDRGTAKIGNEMVHKYRGNAPLCLCRVMHSFYVAFVSVVGKVRMAHKKYLKYEEAVQVGDDVGQHTAA